jgi:hypothetical protein
MRILLGALLLLLLVGCPRGPAQQQAAAGGLDGVDARGKPVASGPPQVVAVAFSATESDPWTSEMIDALGASLGVDPWQRSDSRGSLDVYGPYDTELKDIKLSLVICVSGFTGVVDLEGQEALGAQVEEWLKEQQPDAVWLDGDPLQFQVGRFLPEDWRILFSGIVLDRTLYYSGEQLTTGAYRRYSLPRILGEIWRADSEATRYALLSDDSPTSQGRVLRFTLLEAALPAGHEFVAPAAATSWDELKQQIAQLGDSVDAAVICGAGEDGAAPDFLDNPCPDDLLAEARFPVVVLSPSKADHSGAISLKIKPAAAVAAVLGQLERVLTGTDPRAIPVVTPDDMAVFLAVGEEATAAESDAATTEDLPTAGV